jgi:hypothetical protein
VGRNEHEEEVESMQVHMIRGSFIKRACGQSRHEVKGGKERGRKKKKGVRKGRKKALESNGCPIDLIPDLLLWVSVYQWILSGSVPPVHSLASVAQDLPAWNRNIDQIRGLKSVICSSHTPHSSMGVLLSWRKYMTLLTFVLVPLFLRHDVRFFPARSRCNRPKGQSSLKNRL